VTAARPHLTIVGGGWAGLAAAVAAIQRGWRVSLFEASRHWGGRARRLSVPWPDGLPNPQKADHLVLDNGQHILIGAYTESLRLMRQVGLDDRQLLQRLPLTLPFADGSGLAIPVWARHWPVPLDILAAMLTTHGWTVGERLSLLAHTLAWRWQGFRCAERLSVAELCRGLPNRVRQDLIEPLCVAALNTPAERACGQTFLRVLHDALLGEALPPYRSADLLLPRTDLGSLWPDAAASWLQQQGAELHLGQRVDAVAPPQPGHRNWQLRLPRRPHPQGPGGAEPPSHGPPAAEGHVLLACPAQEAARLLQQQGAALPDAVQRWARQAQGLAYEAIATVYLHHPGTWPAPSPMLALRDGPAQFAFDRSQLGGPPGLLALVASACPPDREQVQAQAMRQAQQELGLTQIRPVLTVLEKRATFACTPGLQRPGHAIAPGLWAAGDAIESPYPATLEGSVRSGAQAVQAISETIGNA